MVAFAQEREEARRQQEAQRRDKRPPACTSSRDGLIQIFFTNKREHAQKLIEAAKNNPASLNSIDFKKVDLSNTNLSGLDLRVLGDAALRQINFKNANLTGQNFQGLNLRGAQFQGAWLEGARLQGANLERANLNGANLTRANLEGCRAAGAQMNNIKAQGAYLSGDFRGVQMNGADLSFGLMGVANFTGAFMRRANLGAVKTEAETTFTNAVLDEATLTGDMTGANFSGASLIRANLEGGIFHKAKFTKARVFGIRTGFAKLDASAFSDVIDEAPLTPELAVNVPKPTFGRSRYVLLRAAQNKLGAEAPQLSAGAMQQHRRLLDLLPTPLPPI